MSPAILVVPGSRQTRIVEAQISIKQIAAQDGLNVFPMRATAFSQVTLVDSGGLCVDIKARKVAQQTHLYPMK